MNIKPLKAYAVAGVLFSLPCAAFAQDQVEVNSDFESAYEACDSKASSAGEDNWQQTFDECMTQKGFNETSEGHSTDEGESDYLEDESNDEGHVED